MPPVCWIILYLQYLIANEGGPELPCMTGLLLLLLLLILLYYHYYYYYYYHYYLLFNHIYIFFVKHTKMVNLTTYELRLIAGKRGIKTTKIFQ